MTYKVVRKICSLCCANVLS